MTFTTSSLRLVPWMVCLWSHRTVFFFAQPKKRFLGWVKNVLFCYCLEYESSGHQDIKTPKFPDRRSWASLSCGSRWHAVAMLTPCVRWQVVKDWCWLFICFFRIISCWYALVMLISCWHAVAILTPCVDKLGDRSVIVKVWCWLLQNYLLLVRTRDVNIKFTWLALCSFSYGFFSTISTSLGFFRVPLPAITWSYIISNT